MSRAQRYKNAIAANDVMEVETLRDELQDWLDNMPDNSQESQKAADLDEAIGNLEEIIDAMYMIQDIGVDFPI